MREKLANVGVTIRRLAPAVLTCSVALLGLLLAACSSLQRRVAEPPKIEGATFVGNQACVDCHKNFTRVFAISPHARLNFLHAPEVERNSVEGIGCESCHGPGSLHVSAGGGRKHIVNPGRDPAACFACHMNVHAQFALPYHHPVLEEKMNCVQCHVKHGADIMKASYRTALGFRSQTGLA